MGWASKGTLMATPHQSSFLKEGSRAFFFFSFNYDIESLALSSYLHTREDIFHFKVGH